jgi:pyrimidine deaminase RibD-like protein
MTDRKLMETAIAMAEHCRPTDPARIPKVGALIQHGDGRILATGWRQDDMHAEKHALTRVSDPAVLPGATVYTTLEPCTPEVRSKPEEACLSLLLDAQVRKVVIGILDPNQGVCGKGVLALQKHDIEVDLFPHDLAQRIRLLNDDFVRAQQTVGVRFLSPEPNALLHTYKTGGKHTFSCECINAPGPDIFVLVERAGLWWPQSTAIRQVGDSSRFEFDCHFGALGIHTIHVVRANELGLGLLNYYRKIVDLNAKQREKLTQTGATGIQLSALHGNYPGIAMPKLPRGLDSQAHLPIEIAAAPA